jgi:hypothetical protein
MKKVVFFLIFALVGYAINAQGFRTKNIASNNRGVIFAHGFETGSGSSFEPGWTTLNPPVGSFWYRD